jgi:hypothetical protein
VVTKMVLLAQRNDLFADLALDLAENGETILQYAYDTMFCISNDQYKDVNLIFCICLN